MGRPDELGGHQAGLGNTVARPSQMPISTRSVFHAETDQNDVCEKKSMCKMTQFLVLDLTNGPSLLHLTTAVPSGMATVGGPGSPHRAATALA